MCPAQILASQPKKWIYICYLPDWRPV
jgi:hypothetical protein